jgi:dihydroxyacetone kinase
MLDALLPAALAATSSASSPDATLASTLAAAAAAATQGAANTRGMAAAAGRSSYVNADVLRDVPDPGAVAVAGWMEALALRRMSE